MQVEFGNNSSSQCRCRL